MISVNFTKSRCTPTSDEHDLSRLDFEKVVVVYKIPYYGKTSKRRLIN